MDNIENYTEEIQEMFLNFLVTDPELFVRVNNIVEPYMFNKRFQDTVKFIQQHSAEYSSIPTIDQIKATTNVELGEVKDFTYKGVTYGGFKLRFGAIGTYCPVNVYNPDPATSGIVPLVWGWCSDTNSGGECTNSAVTWNVPFRYNDQHVDVVDPS